MLQNLSRGLTHVLKSVSGRGRLTESNIDDALRDIRAALLEGDVALEVVRDFLERVKHGAMGRKVSASLNPGQEFTGVVQRELAATMGGVNEKLRLNGSPALVMACGLQGVGKTTTLAKLAKRLKEKQKKRVLMAGLDVRRPAAMAQLETLAESVGVSCLKSDESGDAVARAREIVPQARRELADVALVDTAGRTTLDAEMMGEIRELAEVLRPGEILFFVDAMQGQDALEVAREFADALPLTGIVLTKMDGDSRGGAALSAREAVGKPIKFVGVGEKIDDLEAFYPDRMASRILGMGDVMALVEKAQSGETRETAMKLAKKLAKNKGVGFDLNDQLEQFKQMRQMGGAREMLEKMPGMSAANLPDNVDDRRMNRMEAVILSMTPRERRRPEIVKASRKRRVAAGAGVPVTLVNQLLRQHEQARKMMRRMMNNPAAQAQMMRQFFGGGGRGQ